MRAIEDPDSPELDDFRHLTDAAARRAIEDQRAAGGGAPAGIFIVEGLNAVQQLIGSGLSVRAVLLTPGRYEKHGARLLSAGLPVRVVSREVLRDVTGFDVHRGVIASAARPLPTDPTRLAAVSDRVVVTEAVSDNENVGSLFRVAAAFGLDAVLLDGASGDPFYRRSVRVSSGWSMRVPSARIDSAASTVEQLSHAGISTIALDPHRGTPVDDAVVSEAFGRRFALVVGSEGDGLSAPTLEACSVRVSIPMAAGVDSLNVATALAVVAAFAASRRGWR